MQRSSTEVAAMPATVLRAGRTPEVARPLPTGATDKVGARLRRVEGQVRGVRRMHEEGRYCIDVLDQISAARAALEAVALLVLREHVNGCVQDALERGDGAAKADELLTAIRRFLKGL